VIEVVTRLGDSVVDVMVVPRARLGEAIVRAGFEPPEHLGVPLIVRSDLGTLVATEVGRARRYLPRGPVSWPIAVCLALSSAAHIAVVAYALAHFSADPTTRTGAARPRLVANHATAARGAEDPKPKPSLHDVDTATGAASQTSPPVASPYGQGVPQVDARQQGANDSRVAARQPDPCPGGDCGIIPSGPYETFATGKRAGSEYQLHEREKRELALSVVNCSDDGKCDTISGEDQRDIRAELARHVGDLRGCLRHGAATIDLTIDDGGEVHVHTKDGGEPADCIASVVAKLALHGGRGDVTLAFTAGD
jgi:hypothetical protein